MKRTSSTRPTLPHVPAWLGSTLVGIVLLGFKISMPLTDGDSAFYTRIAQNVVESGNWQTFTFKDYALVDKSPLTLWMIVVSYLLLGATK